MLGYFTINYFTHVCRLSLTIFTMHWTDCLNYSVNILSMARLSTKDHAIL